LAGAGGHGQTEGTGGCLGSEENIFSPSKGFLKEFISWSVLLASAKGGCRGEGKLFYDCSAGLGLRG